MEVEAAKMIGAGLAVIALAGVGVGIGNIFSALVTSIARNPAARSEVFGIGILGFALTEAVEKDEGDEPSEGCHLFGLPHLQSACMRRKTELVCWVPLSPLQRAVYRKFLATNDVKKAMAKKHPIKLAELQGALTGVAVSSAVLMSTLRAKP